MDFELNIDKGLEPLGQTYDLKAMFVGSLRLLQKHKISVERIIHNFWMAPIPPAVFYLSVSVPKQYAPYNVPEISRFFEASLHLLKDPNQSLKELQARLLPFSEPAPSKPKRR